MITKPRTDLPEVGNTIAALHGCGAWYFGALTVLHVDSERRQVEVRPECWAHPGTMVLSGSLDRLQWNLIRDLSPAEQAQMRFAPDPAEVAALAERMKGGFMLGST